MSAEFRERNWFEKHNPLTVRGGLRFAEVFFETTLAGVSFTLATTNASKVIEYWNNGDYPTAAAYCFASGSLLFGALQVLPNPKK